METLREILTHRQFLIPANQRGYSWGKEQARAVIDDLDLARKNGNAHYLGPLVVTTDTEGLQQGQCILDDGQQRLTTCLLLLFAIRRGLQSAGLDQGDLTQEIEDLIYSDTDCRRPRIRIGHSDLDQFLKHILCGDVQPKCRVSAMGRLEEVNDYYRSELTHYSEVHLGHLAATLLDKAKFIIVDLGKEEIDRFLAFDAINSRGVALSEFDKIKNFAVLLNSLRDGLEYDAEAEWYDSLVHLERFGVSSRGDEAAFITEAFSIYFERVVSESKIHEEFVKEFGKLLNEENAAKETKLQKFVKFWAEYARAFGFITSWNRDVLGPTIASAEARRQLTYIDKLKFTRVTRKLLCSALIKFGDADFTKLCSVAEAYTFRVHCFPSDNRTTTHQKELLALASGLYYKRIISFDELLPKIGDLARKKGPILRVFDFLVNGKEKFGNNEGALWKHTYYFLYHYEISLLAAEDEIPDYEREEDDQVASIDFVLPKSITETDEWWSDHWPDHADRARHAFRIGNLVLTNSDLLETPVIYPDRFNHPDGYDIYRDQATRGEQKLRAYSAEAWRPKQIREREIDLAKFAVQRWLISEEDHNSTLEFPDEFGDSSADPNLVINLGDVQI